MIKTLQISGVGKTDIDEDTELYADKKIGHLDRFVPKKSRASLRAEVKLKETKVSDKNRFKCEVIMHLPHDMIAVTERGQSMLAAIDQTENTLKVQLKKYKEKHAGPRLHRRVVNRFKRSL